MVKWSGSKRSQSEDIIKMIPNKEFNTYYEPFVGGASVLYQLLHSDKKFNRYICSDINNDLISLWKKIKNEPYEIINSYEKMWNELNIDDDKKRKKNYFYMVRERFNKEKNPDDFMFIMRTTTNGMPRYNNSGEFNNSFHVTRNGIVPNTLANIVVEWSELLNKYEVEFICTSFENVITTNNDFMYSDPPYPNTKGMYYGKINYGVFWDWLRKQQGSYMFSFPGKTSSLNIVYEVPEDTYSKHEYLYSGNSSFRRIIGKSNKEYVQESLYIK